MRIYDAMLGVIKSKLLHILMKPLSTIVDVIGQVVWPGEAPALGRQVVRQRRSGPRGPLTKHIRWIASYTQQAARPKLSSWPQHNAHAHNFISIQSLSTYPSLNVTKRKFFEFLF
uniref:Uncharacterized protein n=1 Tax=Pectinophora gossypiella TaxID=13191 RepID=A0A1E1WHN0_PECGO